MNRIFLAVVVLGTLTGCSGWNMHYKTVKPGESVGFDNDADRMTQTPVINGTYKTTAVTAAVAPACDMECCKEAKK